MCGKRDKTYSVQTIGNNEEEVNLAFTEFIRELVRMILDKIEPSQQTMSSYAPASSSTGKSFYTRSQRKALLNQVLKELYGVFCEKKKGEEISMNQLASTAAQKLSRIVPIEAEDLPVDRFLIENVTLEMVTPTGEPPWKMLNKIGQRARKLELISDKSLPVAAKTLGIVYDIWTQVFLQKKVLKNFSDSDTVSLLDSPRSNNKQKKLLEDQILSHKLEGVSYIVTNRNHHSTFSNLVISDNQLTAEYPCAIVGFKKSFIDSIFDKVNTQISKAKEELTSAIETLTQIKNTLNQFHEAKTQRVQFYDKKIQSLVASKLEDPAVSSLDQVTAQQCIADIKSVIKQKLISSVESQGLMPKLTLIEEKGQRVAADIEAEISRIKNLCNESLGEDNGDSGAELNFLFGEVSPPESVAADYTGYTKLAQVLSEARIADLVINKLRTVYESDKEIDAALDQFYLLDKQLRELLCILQELPKCIAKKEKDSDDVIAAAEKNIVAAIQKADLEKQAYKAAQKKYNQAYLEFLSHLVIACINYQLYQDNIGCYFDRRQSFGFLTPTITDIHTGLRLNLGLIPNQLWLDAVIKGLAFFDQCLGVINENDLVQLLGDTELLDRFHSEKSDCGDLTGTGHWLILDLLIQKKEMKELLTQLAEIETQNSYQYENLSISANSITVSPDNKFNTQFDSLVDTVLAVYLEAIKLLGQTVNEGTTKSKESPHDKIEQLKWLMSTFQMLSRKAVLSLEELSGTSNSDSHNDSCDDSYDAILPNLGNDSGGDLSRKQPPVVKGIPKYLSSTGMSSLFLPLVAYYDVLSNGNTDSSAKLLCITDPYCYFEIPAFKKSISSSKVTFIDGQSIVSVANKKVSYLKNRHNGSQEPAEITLNNENQKIIVYVDANACVNKPQPPLAAQEIFKHYCYADLIVVDVTSTTTYQQELILELWGKSKTKYLVFAESGLKHRQLGADLVQYGVNKLFIKDTSDEGKLLRDKFSDLTLGESSVYSTRIRHVLADACAAVLDSKQSSPVSEQLIDDDDSSSDEEEDFKSKPFYNQTYKLYKQEKDDAGKSGDADQSTTSYSYEENTTQQRKKANSTKDWYQDVELGQLLHYHCPMVNIINEPSSYLVDDSAALSALEVLKMHLSQRKAGRNIIILNVNALDGSFRGHGHWVALIADVAPNNNDITQLTLVDPMGRVGIYLGVLKSLKEALGDQITLDGLFTANEHPQYVEEKDGEIRLSGNDYDCGLFLVEALRRIAQGERVDVIKKAMSKGSSGNSKAYGQELRKKHMGELLEIIKINAQGEKRENYDDDGGEDLPGIISFPTPPLIETLDEEALLDSDSSESSKKSFGSSVAEPEAELFMASQLKQNDSQHSKNVLLPQSSNSLTELLGPSCSITPIIQKFLSLVPAAVRAQVDLEMGKRYDEIVHGDLWMLGDENSVESTIKALGKLYMAKLTPSFQSPQTTSQPAMVDPKKVPLSTIGSFESLLGSLQLNNSSDQAKIDAAIYDIHYETGINEEDFKQTVVATFKQNPDLLNQYKGKPAELVDYLSDTARELTSGMNNNIN